MLRRMLLLTCATVLLIGAALPASAATGIHGRSVWAQAALDARLGSEFADLDAGSRVQVLDQLCGRPDRIRRCEPISSQLRGALEAEIDARILWVDARRVNGPEFLVFAPVRFEDGVARSEVAFWFPGRSNCFGDATLRFARTQGAWTPSMGSAWEACPARA